MRAIQILTSHITTVSTVPLSQAQHKELYLFVISEKQVKENECLRPSFLVQKLGLLQLSQL